MACGGWECLECIRIDGKNWFSTQGKCPLVMLLRYVLGKFELGYVNMIEKESSKRRLYNFKLIVIVCM